MTLISYLTISTLLFQPQPNRNVCFYISRNAMMTLSGRLRGLKGNTAGAVCAVDLSSFMRAICFNSRYTSYTARPANRKPHNHKHLPSRFSCYSLTLCCTEASNRRLTDCNLSGAPTGLGCLLACCCSIIHVCPIWGLAFKAAELLVCSILNASYIHSQPCVSTFLKHL